MPRKGKTMKYKTTQLGTGKWAVKSGSADKGATTKYFSNSVSETKDEAEAWAAYHTARWHLAQAEKMLAKMPTDRQMDVGFIANDIVSQITDNLEKEGIVSENDPRGWLA